MIIVETPIFTSLIDLYLSDKDYLDMQYQLIKKPDRGKIIKGSGGLRKLRFKSRTKGTRGGVRVIYYWYKSDDEIHMIYIYPKNKKDDLTQKQLKILKNYLEDI